MIISVEQKLKEVKTRIASAANRSGRDPSEVKVVAVSKTHSVHAIRKAIDCGLAVFGENRIQEVDKKIGELGNEGLTWHLIGHLQANKARRAVQLFDVIQSVDSYELAARLERICEEEGRDEMQVFIQVDLAGEATKSGMSEDELPRLIEYLRSCKRLQLKGLMLLPPYFADAEKTRPFFKKLREIRDSVFSGGELSMGMSHDFEIAIEEGATIVRIGTAIFGER